MISEFIVSLKIAAEGEITFKQAWKRAMHIKYGHPFENSVRIDKMRSESHPQNCKDWIYTVNIRECKECGLIYEDSGFEQRKDK